MSNNVKEGKRIWWKGKEIEGAGRQRQAPQAAKDTLKVELFISWCSKFLLCCVYFVMGEIFTICVRVTEQIGLWISFWNY